MSGPAPASARRVAPAAPPRAFPSSRPRRAGPAPLERARASSPQTRSGRPPTSGRISPQERRGGWTARRRPRPDGRHRPLAGRVRAECFQRIRRGREPVEHARHHGVRRRRGHRRCGLLLNHDEVPVARGWMRVREGGRRGDERRGRSTDGGRAQMGKMCVVDGDYAHGPLVLRRANTGHASSFSLDSRSANAARRRNELERTHQAHARQERHERRRPRYARPNPRLPPPGAKDPRGGHRGGQARGETRLATGQGGAVSPRLERTPTARSSVRIPRPRTRRRGSARTTSPPGSGARSRAPRF